MADRPLWIVAAATVVLYVTLLCAAPSNVLAEAAWESSLYREALTDHLWEYLAYTPLKPPLFSLLHAAVLYLADLAGIGQVTALRLYGGALGVVVAPLSYLAARDFGANRWISSPLAILAALSLLPLCEEPLNYDLPVFALLALFLWSVARVVRHSGRAGFVLLSLTAAALVAQSTVQAGVVAIVVALAVGVVTFRGQRLRAAAMTAAAALPAVLVLVLIVVKNVAAFGMAANSTLGGHTLMLFTMANNNWNAEDTRRHAVAAGAPDWYLWCYDHPYSPSGEEFPRSFAKTMGACFAGVDMAALAEQLHSMGALREEAAVRRDMARMSDKPWLLSGVAFDMATEWFALYGSWSARVSSHAFHQSPGHWLRTGAYIHGNLFAARDSDFIGDLLNKKQRDGDYRTWPVVRLGAELSYLVRLLAYRSLPYVLFFLVLVAGVKVAPRTCIGAAALTVGVAALLVSVVQPALWWFQYGFPGGLYRPPAYAVAAAVLAAFWGASIKCTSSSAGRILAAMMPGRHIVAALCCLAAHLLLTAAIYCTVVGTENNRFFVQLLPGLAVLGALLLSWPFALFRRLTALRPENLMADRI